MQILRESRKIITERKIKKITEYSIDMQRFSFFYSLSMRENRIPTNNKTLNQLNIYNMGAFLRNCKTKLFAFTASIIMTFAFAFSAQGQVDMELNDRGVVLSDITPCGTKFKGSLKKEEYQELGVKIKIDGKFAGAGGWSGDPNYDHATWNVTGAMAKGAYFLIAEGSVTGTPIYFIIVDPILRTIDVSETEHICGPEITTLTPKELSIAKCDDVTLFPTKTFTIQGVALDEGLIIATTNTDVTFNGAGSPLNIFQADGEAGIDITVAYTGTTPPVAPIEITCTAPHSLVPAEEKVILTVENFTAETIKPNVTNLDLYYLTAISPEVQTIQVEGFCLKSSITANAPAGFQVSNTNAEASFGQSAILPAEGGTLYVRIDPTQTSADSPSGNITFESGTATVVLTGDVKDKTPETYYFTQPGNWSDLANWKTGAVSCDNGSGGTLATMLPTRVDKVIVCNGNGSVNLTVDVDANCESFTHKSGNSDYYELVIAEGKSLTIEQNFEIDPGNKTAGVEVKDNAKLIVGEDLFFNSGNINKEFRLGSNAIVDIAGDLTIITGNNPLNMPMASGSSVTAENINIVLKGGALTVSSGATLTARGNMSLLPSETGTIAGAGKMQVGGKFSFGHTKDSNTSSRKWEATGITLEMTGCGAEISLEKDITVDTFLQPEGPCSTPFSTTTESLTVANTYDQNCNIINLAEGVAGVDYSTASIVRDVCVPTIFVTQPVPLELKDFESCYNEASASQTFLFYGRALDDDLTIKASSAYEISEDNTNFKESLSYTPNALKDVGSKATPKVVYVRQKIGGTPGASVSGSITLESKNSTTRTISLTGSVASANLLSPANDVYVTSLACASTPSEPSEFIVQGSCIPVDIAVSSDFEISLTKTSYTQTLANVANGTTVYVRTKANATLGNKKGTIEFFDSYGTKPLLKQFDLIGAVQGPTVQFNKTAVRLEKTCVNTVSKVSSFEIAKLCSNSNVTITIDANFEISETETGAYSNSLTTGNKTIYVRTAQTASIGKNEGVISATIDGEKTEIAVSGTVLGGEIIVKEDPIYVGAYVVGNGPSSAKTLTVEAQCLNAAGIALSLDNANFTINKTTIASPYTSSAELKLAAGLAVGEYTGTLQFAAKAADGTTEVKTETKLTGKVIASGCTALTEAEAALGIQIDNKTGAAKLNAKEYQIQQGKAVRIFAKTPEECYSMILEKQSLDVAETQWHSTYIAPQVVGGDTEFNFVPEEGALYRIRYVDNISGNDLYSTDLIVRIHYKCNCENEQEIFFDDFGSFAGSNYIGKDATGNTKTYSDGDFGNKKMVEALAAPDPGGYVRNHFYRFDAEIDNAEYLAKFYPTPATPLTDAQTKALRECTDVWNGCSDYGDNYSGDDDAQRAANNPLQLNLEAWSGRKIAMSGYNFTQRIIDGTYALITNPQLFDYNDAATGFNNDYWNGSDHGGTGAMLFVNVDKNGSDKVIYEREITLGCTALQNGANIVFSAFVNNAVQKLKGTSASVASQANLDNLEWVENAAVAANDALPSPVNVRLDLIDNDPSSSNYTKTIASIASGDLMVRSADNGSDSWANLSYKFPVNSSSYIIRITNNSLGGAGNDILIDDISVSICYPQIELDISRTEKSEEKVKLVCDKNATIPLIALPFDDVTVITDFIPDPYFQFQYRKRNATAWNDYGGILHFTDNIQLELKDTDTEFLGEVEWRVIAAERPAMFADIMNGTLTEPSCSDLYAMSDTYIIRFMPNANEDKTFEGCIGDFKDFTMKVPVDFEGNAYTEWQLVDASDGVVYSSGTTSADWTRNVNEITFAAATKNSASNSLLKIGETAQTYTFKAIAPDANNCGYENTITYAAGGWCLEVEKTADNDAIDFEDNAIYTVTVTNTDTKDVSNVVLEDVLPTYMDYVSHATTIGLYSETTGDWNIGTLTVGATATLTINVKNSGGQGSEIKNTAWIKSRNESVWNSADDHCVGASCCPLIDTAIVEINSPIEIELEATSVCLGKTPAKATATITRKQSDVAKNVTYQWTWNTLTASNKQTQTWTSNVASESWDIATAALSAGSYTIAVQVLDADNANKLIAQASTTLVVKPLPTIVVANTEECLNVAATLSASGADSYVWEKIISGTATPAPWGESESGVATATLSVTPATVGDHTYKVTGTDSEGCENTKQATVTVNPLPEMTISALPDEICEGSSINITFSFSVGTPTYTVDYKEGASSAQKIVTLADLTPNYSFSVTPAVTTTYSIDKITDGNGCVKNVTGESVEVTVIPEPTVAIDVLPTSLCVDVTPNTLALSIVKNHVDNVQWTITPAGWGSFDNATAESPTYTIGTLLASELSKKVTIAVEAGNAVCAKKATDTHELTVYNTPIAAIKSGDDEICENETLTLALDTDARGENFDWEITSTPVWGSLSGSTYTPGTFAASETDPKKVTVQLTASNGVCTDDTDTYEITINPTPVLSSSLTPPTICSDDSFTYTATSLTPGTTFAWSRAAVAGITQAAASGTGASISETLTNTTTAPINVVYEITLAIGDCENKQNVTVTVNPTPKLNSPLTSPAICSETTFAYTATSLTTGTTFSWTRAAIAGITPATASGTTATISEDLTNTTNAPIDVEYEITLKIGNCTNTQTVTVTVNPTPTLDALTSANQTVCNGNLTSAVVFTGNAVSGVVYDWTNSNTNIGLAASGKGDISAFTATNSTDAPISGTITVTPTANGCDGVAKSFVITVNPTASITPKPADQEICNNDRSNAVVFTSNIASGVSYEWVNSNSSIGLASNGTGNIAAFTATNSTNTPISGTITVTPTFATCPGTPENFTITVNPSPTVSTLTAAQAKCAGELTDAVIFTSNIASGVTYSWTNNTPSIGLAASGTGNIAAFTATNSGNSPVTATITVTPEINSCEGKPITVTITVNPVPTITAIDNQELCHAAATKAINFTGNITSGVTYDWTNTNTAIGLGANGAGNIASFTATNTTTAPISGTITVTPTANACQGTATSFTITVNPNPVANITLDAYCDNDFWTNDPITLSGNPTGGSLPYQHEWKITPSGTYTITPNNTAENPTITFTSQPSGNANISYTVTDSKGCKTTATPKSITVKAQPKATIEGDIPLCLGDSGTGDYQVVRNDGTPFPTGTKFTWYYVIDGNEQLYKTTVMPENEAQIPWRKTTYRAQVKVLIETPQNVANCMPTMEAITEEFGVYEKPYAMIEGPTHACVGDITEYTFQNSGAQKDNTTYTWNVANALGGLSTNANNTKATVEWTEAGTELIELDLLNGVCASKVIYSVEVHPLPQPDFSFQPSEKVYFQSENSYRIPDEIYPGKEVQFINETTEQRGSRYSYQWDFAGDGVFTKASNDVNEDIFFTYDEAGDYTAQLHVVDEQWGCENIISKPVEVGENPNCGLTFPNAFTPDKSTNNSFYAVYNEGVLESGYELRIFDRWGTLLWKTNDKSAHWDGRYRGEIARQDVYVYHCRATCEETDANGNHRELNIKGDVTVVR